MKASVFRDADARLDTLVPGAVTRKIRAYGERLMFVEVYFEGGASGAMHDHPHEQLTYCLEGEFEFTAGDLVEHLRVGDSILIPGGMRHGVRCLARGRLLDSFSPPREDFLAR